MVVYDGGVAPCHQNGLTTLNVCKTQTRARAQVGDVVMGLTGRQLVRAEGPQWGDLLWIGIVEQVVTMRAYAHAYPDRQDSMYTFNLSAQGYEAELKDGWGQRNVAKDLGGKNTLIFGRVLRFSRTSLNAHLNGLCFGKGNEHGCGRATLRTARDVCERDPMLDALEQVADAPGTSMHLSAYVPGNHTC